MSNHTKFLDRVTLSHGFFEIFTIGICHRDMKALKILALQAFENLWYFLKNGKLVCHG